MVKIVIFKESSAKKKREATNSALLRGRNSRRPEDITKLRSQRMVLFRF
jgi:hypothetical protein